MEEMKQNYNSNMDNEDSHSEENFFLLKKVKGVGGCSPVKVCFSPPPLGGSRSGLGQETGGTVPRFNADGCHFTASFILGSEEVLIDISQKFLQSNLGFERMRFEERIQNASEKNLSYVSFY